MATSSQSPLCKGTVVLSPLSLRPGIAVLPPRSPMPAEIESCVPMALTVANRAPLSHDQADTSLLRPAQPSARDIQRLLAIQAARQAADSMQNGASDLAAFHLMAAQREPFRRQALSMPGTRAGLFNTRVPGNRRGNTVGPSSASPFPESERRERELRAREDAKMSAAKRKMGKLHLPCRLSSVTN
jgi:hypothetical protein